MMTPATARPRRKLKIPAALRSLRSYSVRSERSGLLAMGSVMCWFQNLSRMRVVQGQQWPPFQVAEKQREPTAADRNWNHYVPYSHMQLFMKGGLNHPEKIHNPHEHQPHCQPHQRA